MIEGSIWIAALLGFVSSFLGGMLGIGGGVFIVPVLILFLHLPAHVAVSSSLICIVATASTASITYINNNLTNIRLSLLLIACSIPGAIAGSFIANSISTSTLVILLSILLVAIAVSMLFRVSPKEETLQQVIEADYNKRINRPYWWSFYDLYLQKDVYYRITRLPLGMVLSFLGGVISSIFGVGGGVIFVPVMALVMGVPIKIAIACSSFIIGITAACGSIIHYYHGYIQPLIIAPLVLGSFVGARLGSLAAQKVNAGLLKKLFFMILILIAAVMILRLNNIIPL
ncbi:MAG TPA: sulfite exporter TauE/SafE family protein [Dehalococcoidia bacterium]|nr:sulfite exporter TauE/SafE family protein [Dehalococcoidia bacterium]